MMGSEPDGAFFLSESTVSVPGLRPDTGGATQWALAELGALTGLFHFTECMGGRARPGEGEASSTTLSPLIAELSDPELKRLTAELSALSPGAIALEPSILPTLPIRPVLPGTRLVPSKPPLRLIRPTFGITTPFALQDPGWLAGAKRIMRNCDQAQGILTRLADRVEIEESDKPAGEEVGQAHGSAEWDAKKQKVVIRIKPATGRAADVWNAFILSHELGHAEQIVKEAENYDKVRREVEKDHGEEAEGLLLIAGLLRQMDRWRGGDRDAALRDYKKHLFDLEFGPYDLTSECWRAFSRLEEGKGVFIPAPAPHFSDDWAVRERWVRDKIDGYAGPLFDAIRRVLDEYKSRIVENKAFESEVRKARGLVEKYGDRIIDSAKYNKKYK